LLHKKVHYKGCIAFGKKIVTCFCLFKSYMQKEALGGIYNKTDYNKCHLPLSHIAPSITAILIQFTCVNSQAKALTIDSSLGQANRCVRRTKHCVSFLSKLVLYVMPSRGPRILKCGRKK
jgi:hypothetical protein